MARVPRGCQTKVFTSFRNALKPIAGKWKAAMKHNCGLAQPGIDSGNLRFRILKRNDWGKSVFGNGRPISVLGFQG